MVIVTENTRLVPMAYDVCFSLKHKSMMTRQTEGSVVWEKVKGSSMDEPGEHIMLTQKALESVFFTVYGIRERMGHTPFSNNEELLEFSFLLKNDYEIRLKLMWESENPYQITLQKALQFTQTGGRLLPYAQNFRFKFALLGGKIAKNADGATFTILNESLLSKKKQVLRVESLRSHNGMDTFQHKVKRTLSTYIDDFSDAVALEFD